MVIYQICKNIAIEEVDVKSIAEIEEMDMFDVKIVVVYEANCQLAMVAEVHDELDWVYGVARVAHRVDIHRVIDFL